jgi:DHA2 family multidrug resistance protein
MAHASAGNPRFRAMIEGMSHAMTMHGINAFQATHKAYAMMYGEIIAQATTLGYVDVVSVLALVVACLTPLPFIMKRGLPGTGGGGMH